MMSTGDLKGCLRRLDAQLRALKYPREVDYNSLSKGDPAAFLPIVSYAFVSFSPHLAEHLVGFGVELTGKSDLRFIEAIYKVLRDLFHYKPAVSKQQFLQFGFVERKTSVLCDIIALALQKHKELSRPGQPKPRVRSQTWGSESKSEVVPFPGDTVKSTAPALSPGRPLVERHLSRRAFVSASTPSEDQNSQEEDEEDLQKCQGVKEVQEQLSTVPQTDPVVEGRLAALEAQLLQVQTRLGRLLALEQRLGFLEQSSEGTVTIDRRQWEHLESRVLLLETSLALFTATSQRESSVLDEGGSHDVVENSTETTESRHGPLASLPHTGGCGHVQSSIPGASYPISPSVETGGPEGYMKERLERISNMMKDTSSLLRSIDSSK